jgi:CelD/BcsL family acetyltransferase involved in cellulose biosynthesis
VASMSQPTPFLLHAWLLEWWRYYGAGTELTVHVAHRNGRLVAGLPLCVRPRLGLRIAHFLGGRQSVLRDVVLAPGEDRSTAALLADAAASSADLTEVYGIRRESALTTAVDQGGWTLVERLRSPFLDLSAGWEAFSQRAISTRARREDGRRRRRLEELGQLDVYVAQSPEDVPTALEECFRLHALRWHGRPNMSWFGTSVGMRFHRAAFERLAPQGYVRIVLLKLDGRAIAFTCRLLLAGQLFAMTTAFDPGYARYSPGRLALLATLERAAEEGVGRVWLLGGTEEYKLRLAEGFEPLCEAVGLARTYRGRAAALVLGGGLQTRMRLKDSPAARRLYYEALGPLRRGLRHAVPGPVRR